ncbi:rho guanine nucleotide exchange factor 10-like protein isoform X1 [Arapaima gigas]
MASSHDPVPPATESLSTGGSPGAQQEEDEEEDDEQGEKFEFEDSEEERSTTVDGCQNVRPGSAAEETHGPPSGRHTAAADALLDTGTELWGRITQTRVNGLPPGCPEDKHHSADGSDMAVSEASAGGPSSAEPEPPRDAWRQYSLHEDAHTLVGCHLSAGIMEVDRTRLTAHAGLGCGRGPTPVRQKRASYSPAAELAGGANPTSKWLRVT